MTALMTDEQHDSDARLASRAAAGERVCLERLVERHYDFVFRIAWRLTGHRADAEDVAQDVCARLGRAIRGYRGGAAFSTWLYAIVLNAVRDRARQTAREAVRREAYGKHQLMDQDEADPVEDSADALWDAVRLLPPKQCQAVTLVYGEEMSHASAAMLMGCTETTVSWHIHEAKKRLKTIVSAGEV
ncbi:RNA polymerase sigma factor [Mesorhizobium sp. CAU 1741]|uniref:RNA polymerase sigma factor n=1 Tax=Mesorhizobium sp. CAU 1741 TaxID=3140366 RepID=UPI00325BE071